MKKIFSITFLCIIFSLFCSFSYDVRIEENSTLSDEDIKKNNIIIEERLKKVFDINLYSKDEINTIIKREYDFFSTDDDKLKAHTDFITNLFSNTKYEIKEINYLSPSSAIVTFIISIPDISALEAEDKQNIIFSNINKKFQEKTNMTLESITKNKELERKYSSLLGTLYLESVSNEIKNIKTYNKSEVSHQLEKNGDIWNFVDKSVNFFLK